MTFRLKDKYLALYSIPEVTNYIQEFFNTSKFQRPRVRYSVDRKCVSYFDVKAFQENKTKKFVAINKDNILSELAQGTSHFYTHIFDDDCLINGLSNYDNWDYKGFVYNFKEYAESNIKGITYVVDIDSPRVYPNIAGNTERYDFFQYINSFDEATKLVAEQLDDITEYNCMFSGNGFYFILESEYGSPEDINTYKLLIEERLNKVDEYLKEMNIPIIIGAKMEGWSRYYKFPFVFHRSRPRISIPLNNNQIGHINEQWLNQVTNTSNIIKFNSIDNEYNIDVGILKEIINKANWSKIW